MADGTKIRYLRGPRGPKGDPGPKGITIETTQWQIYLNLNYIKGDQGRDGLSGQPGVQGPPGHVFMVPLNQNAGNEKGPDTHAEAFRQMLAQHMVS